MFPSAERSLNCLSIFLQKYHFNVYFTEPAGSFVTCAVLYNLLKQSKDVSDLISPGKSDHSCRP